MRYSCVVRALNASSPSFTIWTGDWLTTRVRPERFFTAAAAAVRSSAWPHAEPRLRVSVATLKTWTQTFTSVDLQFFVQPSETNADADAARDRGRPHRRICPPLSHLFQVASCEKTGIKTGFSKRFLFVFLLKRPNADAVLKQNRVSQA